MAEAQLQFLITNQSLKLIKSYTPTEGSNNYVHASFELAPDANIENPVLAVFVRYDNKIYLVPKDEESGLYIFGMPYMQYPGFYVSCRVFNATVSRYTEEVYIKVAGNGLVLNRYLKAPDQYHMELLTNMYGQLEKNTADIKELQEKMQICIDKIDVLAIILKAFANNGQVTFNTLRSDLDLLDKIPQVIPEPEPAPEPEPEEEDPTQGGLIAGDGYFIG